jgi:hypothetical protein
MYSDGTQFKCWLDYQGVYDFPVTLGECQGSAMKQAMMTFKTLPISKFKHNFVTAFNAM